ncbi:hypothetical protein FRB94_014394 [Tulasnella sp. JGI-2019a]|nr:hypothetical protein FRB94_014394 [Tulasnella sp. JGI-2019a]KAG9008620.1 hypothetical protein FRB93_006539 [Tulasnella sp. JGI-2019a]KAG9038487.1 hypothetical protein FRB95_001344 [Tulasnella sp. JGI-2019a]
MDDPLTFISPEGAYTQLEEHKPPALHSYYSSLSASSPTAAQIATRVSIVTVTFPAVKQPSSQAFSSLLGGNKSDKHNAKKVAALEGKHQPTLPAVHDKDESESSGDNPNPNPDDPVDIPPRNPSPPPAADHPHHPVLFSPTLGAGLPSKKKSTRSKQNLKTTTSSFVTRYQAMEGFSKHLAAKTGDVNFMFYNSGKSFFMTEMETANKLKEPPVRVTFNAWPTCHAVNQSTATSTSLDVLIGFNTGDLMWFDPINTRYIRLNKQGCITSSPCTSIRWVPGSRTLFLASHADGTIVVYDKEREDDASFTPSVPPTGPSASSVPVAAHPSPSIMTNSTIDDSTAVTSLDTPLEPALSNPFSFTGIGRHLQLPTAGNNRLASFSATTAAASSSLPAWDPTEEMWVTRPGGTWDGSDSAVADKDKEKEMALAATKNPVSHWRVAKKGIVDFVFSPDVRYIAIVSEDGYLRVVDALNEILVDTYASYFGSLTCVAWSPDGRFIAVGGQDDLITIFSPQEQRVIARCQGHVSFVAGIAFDPFRCDGRNYRFASVGEDCRLLLWDFSSGTLHRPRLLAPHHHRSSVSSQYSLVLRNMSSGGVGARSSFDGYESAMGTIGGTLEHATNASKFHPAPSRKEVSLVQPILSKAVEGDLLSCIVVVPGSIVTASRPGTIKVWGRPPPPVRGPRRTKGGRKRDETGAAEPNMYPGASAMSGDTSAVRVTG